MEIHFILIHPKIEGNIGASARAIKTMGFDSLRLVSPRTKQWRSEVSRAHGSKEILDDARIFATTPDAIADLDFLVGTTARRRGYEFDFVSSRDLATVLAGKEESISKVGILFGTEPEGLSNDDLALCDIASSIPMGRPQPSLNLSQAVMIYAYELGTKANLQPHIHRSSKVVGAEAGYQSLKRSLSSLLEDIGIRPDSVLYRRTLEKVAHLDRESLDLAHYLNAKICDRLANSTQSEKERP